MLGSSVGVSLGFDVGNSDGRKVGKDDGFRVGTAEGINDSALGETEGAIEGFGVGQESHVIRQTALAGFLPR